MEKQGATYPQATEMHSQQPPVYHDPNSPPPQGQPYAPPQGYPAQSPMQHQQTGQPQYFQQQPQHTGQYAGSPPAGQFAGSPAPQAHTPGAQSQMMQGTEQRQFQNVTPIASLGRGPAPVDCPACGQRAMSSINYEVGNSTHAWALALCCLVCLGCIPYLMNSLKDVQHKCGRCGVLLATWHRSGSTEVHIHS
ncbi:hypothetical protein EJ05DRAFT_248408 [Pseudovirgaria hyperparasitica]|uniref:LITAF domain-containing protein n=1 Tax=Pseudovirgaria hyperparasitica TaxID=470096 RepID=A0A6A6WDT2_9PEZI|nr:uncharacterized protein EJ05DRAFT_248408 [Pseudovirgaria hyperparasitica]KAF2760978.1 hypothetical protein EJ05DRAFT_248408 [Pseudovirgaria hyperparasitica]